MGAKATNAEKKRRVNTIGDLLMMGTSRAEILQYAADKSGWGVSERTIDEYIAEATEQFRRISDYNREEQVGKAIRRLEMLFLRAMKVQDFQRALATQRELNLLLGLHESKKLEISGSLQLSVINQLAHALEEKGMKPSEVFERMLQRLAQDA